jgi:antitoxin YefM
MKTASVTEFRQRAKELLKEIEEDQDILIISRPKSQAGFVVLPMDQYESLQETAHLLSTEANARHLWESVAQHKAGNVVSKALIEPGKSARAHRTKQPPEAVGASEPGKRRKVLRDKANQVGARKIRSSKIARKAKKK